MPSAVVVDRAGPTGSAPPARILQLSGGRSLERGTSCCSGNRFLACDLGVVGPLPQPPSSSGSTQQLWNPIPNVMTEDCVRMGLGWGGSVWLASALEMRDPPFSSLAQSILPPALIETGYVAEHLVLLPLLLPASPASSSSFPYPSLHEASWLPVVACQFCKESGSKYY